MGTFGDLKARGSAFRESVLKGSVFKGSVFKGSSFGDLGLRDRVLRNTVIRRLLLLILAAGVSLAVMAAAVAVPLAFLAHAGSGDPTEISLDVLEQRSYVHAADGSVLAGLHGEINREPVTLEEVPDHLVNAIIAVEDQGFWVHDGVDVRGALRALAVNVDEGGVAQGGSTLTQQVVKLSLLGSEQSLERKVKEVVLAQRLEKELTKDEILTRYINVAYFGHSAYGVQAAAETYFGVSSDELDIGQSALLAGMIRTPSFTDPVRYPEKAAKRRSDALGQMREMGFITPEEQEWFDATPLPTEVQRVVPPPDDYFVDEVKEQLLHDDRFDVLGDTYEERERAVFQGGLRIHTTFDPGAQLQALAARDEVLPGENGVFTAGTDSETGEERQGSGALVSVDPATGAVRTMVGGPGFERGVENATGQQFNLASRNRRQGGSTHKMWVLASLMEQGYSPQDLVNGIGPCTFANPGGEQDPYTVPNYEGKTGEVDTILAQTLRSSNCSYMRLAFIADHENVVDIAERLGIRSPLRNEQSGGVDISLPLGVKETTPLEMASAYATIANDGVYNAPYYIESIEGADGRVIYRHEPDPERVVSTDTARLVTSVLEQNTISGTGTRARVPDHPTAGKTGTTNRNSDVWFVGYTQRLATAVWVGGLGSNEPIRIEGASPSSSRHPAQMFGIFMGAYHEGKEPLAFPEPPNRPGGTYLQPDRSDDLSGSSRPDEEQEDEEEEEDEDDSPRPPSSWPPRPTLPTETTASTDTTFPWPTLPTTVLPPVTDDPGGGGGGGRPRPGGGTD